MSFMTVLEKIGHDIAVVFEKAVPIVEEAQVIATPFENLYAPGLAQIVNLAISKITTAESLAAAAGQQVGSGGTKLAFVATALAPEVAPILATLGVQSVNSTQYNNFVSALVTALNSFTTTTPSVVPPASTQVVAPVTSAAIPGK
jgi:hypothetical protein